MTVNMQHNVRIPRSVRTPFLPVLLLITAGFLSGCSNKSVSANSTSMPPMPVSVVEIAPADVGVASEWVGTMDGFVNAQIQPQASGYLIRQLYKEGSQVAKDQVLFEIDPRPSRQFSTRQKDNWGKQRRNSRLLRSTLSATRLCRKHMPLRAASSTPRFNKRPRERPT